ncbi:thioredoxin-dependent thiol peroxidase [Candidatus Saccharibacteria bacterium]|nr:thioredoxin-dependent thiol peroxidase [Candidatus Saccharibacteria bacterium]
MNVPFPAPDFSLQATDKTTVSLSNYFGKWVVLYFYPKDNTPGCTAQACSLRDSRDELTKLGAQVIGVSKDDIAAHEAFKQKYNLNFTLLSDKEGEVIRAYGAWGKKQFGREGILRKTFIINPKGQIVKVFSKAIPLGYGEKVVEALKELQAAQG